MTKSIGLWSLCLSAISTEADCSRISISKKLLGAYLRDRGVDRNEVSSLVYRVRCLSCELQPRHDCGLLHWDQTALRVTLHKRPSLRMGREKVQMQQQSSVRPLFKAQ